MLVEIEVLLLRSCLPVHPICAAIQSVGICKRDIERDGATGVGQAVLPAVLLHGTFDFVLMLLAMLDKIYEDLPAAATAAPTDPNEPKDLEMPPTLQLLLSFGIAGAGLAYYFYESNQQRERLNALVATHDSSLSLALT